MKPRTIAANKVAWPLTSHSIGRTKKEGSTKDATSITAMTNHQNGL